MLRALGWMRRQALESSPALVRLGSLQCRVCLLRVRLLLNQTLLNQMLLSRLLGLLIRSGRYF